MILSPLVDGISNFLGETCLHGFKYLGPNNGVLTRVVWVSQNLITAIGFIHKEWGLEKERKVDP